MDHNFVIENKTAERYLLGELNDAERDAYEDHYFECPECAEELLCGTEFMHYAREVFKEDTEQEAVAQSRLHQVAPAVYSRPFWMRAMPVGAFAVLLLAAGIGLYHRSPGGTQEQGQVEEIAEVIQAPMLEARGAAHGERETIYLRRNQSVMLPFRIDSAHRSPEFLGYRAVIERGTGKPQLVYAIPEKELDDVVKIQVPAGKLDYQVYKITIQVRTQQQGDWHEMNERPLEYEFEIAAPKN